MRMRKQTVTKDDGRLITYYWFDRKGGIEGSRVPENRFRPVVPWNPGSLS